MKTSNIIISSRKAFERCFRDNYQPLCYFANNMLGDETDAEDAVQEVFIKMLQLETVFYDETHLKNYLYQAVHHQCISRKRQTDRTLAVPIDSATDCQLDTETEALLVKSEIISEISKAVDSLPERQREVFRLAYLEDKSNDEIAEILGIQKNTVKVQKQRAKQQLRERLKDLYPMLFIFIKYVTI